jgi:hypothetical protein
MINWLLQNNCTWWDGEKDRIERAYMLTLTVRYPFQRDRWVIPINIEREHMKHRNLRANGYIPKVDTSNDGCM